jgi:2-isopropylmalate synthase
MAIYTQKRNYGVDLKINTREIAATSRLVSSITGVPVPNHKAIVGANAFMHASGIHQDGVLKETQTYEIIDPEIIGVPRNQIVLSARSGRHALKHRLQELGYSLEDSQVETVYENFLLLADKKQEVYDEDLHALMGETVSDQKLFRLKNIAWRLREHSRRPPRSLTVRDQEDTDALSATAGRRSVQSNRPDHRQPGQAGGLQPEIGQQGNRGSRKCNREDLIGSEFLRRQGC